ncbi:MAG: 2Fe-2S iron-sulfur cluster binding domain-containing protein [Comamonadaceae bacterium]|nr:MAG: 2Fe-2S iron-sulfur cluster binding domain-containing protein [Comamonadaceae bacterium]
MTSRTGTTQPDRSPALLNGDACSTCKATLPRGTVHMEQNYALGEDDVARGAVLTCQSRPTSSAISISYDSYDSYDS